MNNAGLRVYGTYEPYTVVRSSTDGAVLNFDTDFIETLDRYFSGENIVLDKSQINWINGYGAYADHGTDTAKKVYEKFDQYLGGL